MMSQVLESTPFEKLPAGGGRWHSLPFRIQRRDRRNGKDCHFLQYSADGVRLQDLQMARLILIVGGAGVVHVAQLVERELATISRFDWRRALRMVLLELVYACMLR
jgi:hypothetical protein